MNLRGVGAATALAIVPLLLPVIGPPPPGAPSAAPYLAFGVPSADRKGTGLFLAVEPDQAELVEHIEHDGAQNVVIYDAKGRQYQADKFGVLRLTGATMTAEQAAHRIEGTFAAVGVEFDREVPSQPATCAESKQEILEMLTPTATQESGWPAIAQDAERRVAWIHNPANDLPFECYPPDSSHKAGYLHNLWHRIMGT